MPACKKVTGYQMGSGIVTVVSHHVRVSRHIGLFVWCTWSTSRARDQFVARRLRSEPHDVGLEEILFLQCRQPEGLFEGRNIRRGCIGGLCRNRKRLEEPAGERVELASLGDEHEESAHHDTEEDDCVDGARACTLVSSK
jgi:hypothetical protein